MKGQGARGKKQGAYLSEIFSSIQGEGLLVGLRQIFVRFAGCSLTCDYCDTPKSRIKGPEFNIIRANGLFTMPNPVSSENLTDIVNSFQTKKNLHHSISLTGGEPLEQVDFLEKWLPELSILNPTDKVGSKGGMKIYLETNGLLPAHLSEVIGYIHIIGMDIKLPSVAGVKPFWNLHRDFLRIASKRQTFVKVVVDRKINEEELMQAAELVYSVDSNIPFIIQPRTPIDMDAVSLLRLQESSAQKLTDVRVIPQTHKFLNMR